MTQLLITSQEQDIFYKQVSYSDLYILNLSEKTFKKT